MATRVTRRDVETLIGEIQLYLEAIDAFRAQGCEPYWRPEPSARRGASR
jgi:hypothetical protein